MYMYMYFFSRCYPQCVYIYKYVLHVLVCSCVFSLKKGAQNAGAALCCTGATFCCNPPSPLRSGLERFN